MGIKISLLVVIALIAGVFLGVEVAGMQYLFGVILPYAAFAIFVIGLIWRVVKWGKSPVPFRIPTTAGQQKSHDWIKHDKFDNPSDTAGVIGRMLMEVLFFRSLFRNTKAELTEDKRLVYQWEKWLWLASLAFHWSFLIVLVRHLRLFTDPVPGFIQVIASVDGAFMVNLQPLFLTGVILLVTVTYLFVRRVVIPQVRYVSLPADYFPLFLIFGIALSGILMRYFIREDVTSVKELAMGLVTFSPVAPEGISALFYVHFLLVCVLFAYFPYSKLVHAGAVMMSPTRNMANNNRAVRHVNPWNNKVKVHTYEEYEDDFRQVMKAAGLPLDKEESDKDKDAG